MPNTKKNWINRQTNYIHNEQMKSLRHAQILWSQKESYCLQHLLKLIGKETFIPDTAISMSPVMICHILNDIILNNRKNILEFGSGNSTIFITLLLAKLGIQATFDSIDDNIEWIDITKSVLESNGVRAGVNLIHAPITATGLSDNSKWYSTTIMRERLYNKKFDLVIVDGPKGALCPSARFPAADFVKDRLCESYIFFLDDINRSDEYITLEKWSNLLGQKISYRNERYGCISNDSSFFSFPI